MKKIILILAIFSGFAITVTAQSPNVTPQSPTIEKVIPDVKVYNRLNFPSKLQVELKNISDSAKKVELPAKDEYLSNNQIATLLWVGSIILVAGFVGLIVAFCCKRSNNCNGCNYGRNPGNPGQCNSTEHYGFVPHHHHGDVDHNHTGVVFHYHIQTPAKKEEKTAE